MKRLRGIKLLIALLVFGLLMTGCKEGGINKTDDEEIKEDVVVEPTELSIHNHLVMDLVYPLVNEINVMGFAGYTYQETSIETMERDILMLSAYRKTVDEKDDELVSEDCQYNIKASEIRDNFVKIFGPDTAYSDGKVNKNGCCLIGKYNEKKDTYVCNCCCGGDGPMLQAYREIYKAELEGEYLRTYFYVQPFIEWCDFRDNVYSADGLNVYYSYFLYKKDTTTYYQDAYVVYTGNTYKIVKKGTKNSGLEYDFINYFRKIPVPDYELEDDEYVDDSLNEEFVAEIQEMIKRGEVDTYVFTFKKQSDGKYYFYSADWQ